MVIFWQMFYLTGSPYMIKNLFIGAFNKDAHLATDLTKVMTLHLDDLKFLNSKVVQGILSQLNFQCIGYCESLRK